MERPTPTQTQDAEHASASLAMADGKSYFDRRAATMSAVQLRGLPRLSQGAAGALSGAYAFFALAVAVLYYSTIGVGPSTGGGL